MAVSNGEDKYVQVRNDIFKVKNKIRSREGRSDIDWRSAVIELVRGS